MKINGFNVFLDSNLVVQDGTYIKYVNRSWKERFFGKLRGKYAPFVKYKLVTFPNYVPDPNAYYVGLTGIVLHPETWKRVNLVSIDD